MRLCIYFIYILVIGVELGGEKGEVPLAELLRGGTEDFGHPNDIKGKN